MGLGASVALQEVSPSDTSADPRSLVELLERSVARFAERPLFLHKVQEAQRRAPAPDQGGWQTVTYASFAALVDRARAGLAALGVGPGDKVGIIANNRLEWATLAYATYGLGAALVPMYESQHEREWAFIAEDAGLSVLFAAGAAIHAKVAPLARTVPGLSHVVLLEGEGESSPAAGVLTFAEVVRGGASGGEFPPPVHPAPEDVACLLYTSGTTGEPKGVVLTHANIMSNLLALYRVIPLEPEHRSLSFLPWAHALGHTVELHMMIAAGASTGIAESVDRLVQNFLEVRPTVLVAVPRVFLKIYAGVEKLMATKPGPIRALYRRGVSLGIARGRGQRLSLWSKVVLAVCDRLVFAKIRARFGGRLQFAVSGAAALATEVAEFMEALGIQVFEGYGLTETSPIVSGNVPGQRRLGSVGRPLPGVRVTIDLVAAGGRTGDPRDGEIVVHGPNVMAGYHRREADNQAIFTADGGLRTGDLGYLDQDGYLYITGRLKEQYKLQNGKYVVPAPLEERLKLSPFIANLTIYGDNRPFNVALVVPAIPHLEGWARDQGWGPLAPGELLIHPAVKQAIRAEIDRLSSEWRGYERVRAFALLPEDFTQQNDMLTPSLKIKRRNVVVRWREEIERLYRDHPDDHRDGRLPA
jgi:long-chain acyl-CoA synthetase